MNALSYERRQELIQAAHRSRNEEVGRLFAKLFARLTAQPKLRQSRMIALHRGC
ncbi:MAG TPA: hypothetical protein VEU32_19845 [Burkholderiales bacterium]|nr:hypothetical protein [Burkholderiales bacterium]